MALKVSRTRAVQTESPDLKAEAKEDLEETQQPDIEQEEQTTEKETKHEESVPYKRFQSINKKYREALSRIEELETPTEEEIEKETPKPSEKPDEFYADPRRYVDERHSETLNVLRSELSRNNAIRWATSRKDFSPELEERMSDIIKRPINHPVLGRIDLNALGPEAAVVYAYQLAGGRDLPGSEDSVEDQYTTRQTKEYVTPIKGGAKASKGSQFSKKSIMDMNEDEFWSNFDNIQKFAQETGGIPDE